MPANQTSPDPPSAVPVGTMLGYSTASFGANMVNALSNAAMPLYLGTYGLPNVLIGFLAQERSFVGAFVQPVVGIISDRTRSRFGRRKPFFLIGIPLTMVALMLLALHPDLWVVLCLLAVFSFFLAVANDPYLALMADITPEHQRGRMGSAMALFNMCGQVTMLALAWKLWETHEFWVFAAVAFGLLVSFGVTFLTVQEPALPYAPESQVKLSPVQYVRNVLQYREVAKYVSAQFFFNFGSGAAVPFLTRFGVDVLHTDEGTAFQLMLIAVTFTALFAVPAGMAGDKFGKKPVLAGGLAVYAVAALVGSQAQDLPQAQIMMATLGACNAVTTALVFPLLADLMPPSRKGEFTGLGSLVWSIAQPMGSTWAGFMVDLSGSFRTVFLVAGVMIGLSFLGLLTVHPDRAHIGEQQPDVQKG